MILWTRSLELTKKVLILGVGNAQVEAIRHCRERGWEVHGVSYRTEGRGLPLVNRFAVINIVDKEAILKYAIENGIDLVYSIGSDLAMPTAGYVSEKLGKPCLVSAKTAELMQNKGSFRTFLQGNNLSPIPFAVAATIDDLRDWNIYPAIIKPVDAQGQRGIFELNSCNDLEAHFQDSCKRSRCGQVIVEQYIDSPEISINAFMFNGEMIYSFITDRFVVPGLPGGIIRGHRIPSRINQAISERAVNLAGRLIKALDIESGPVYFQMKYTTSDVHIIEVAPRLDGCHLWRMIKLMYGVDLLQATFDLLAGEDVNLPLSRQQPAPILDRELFLEFHLQETGASFRKPDAGNRELLHQEFYYKTGEQVREINGLMEKTGYMIYPVTN
jgi:biotin carboxylase